MSNEKRTTRVNIRLSDEMKNRAQTLADDLGTPLSTYLALLIGEGVMNKERQSQLHTEAMNGIVGHAKGLIDDFTKGDMTPEQLKFLQSLTE